MPVLVAATVLLGLLTLVNLLLILGVVRRLREHTELLSRPSPRDDARVLPAGATVGDFTATTTDGQPVSRDALVDETLVGFFSPGCDACDALLPEFIDRAATAPRGRAGVLAVVEADQDAAQRYVAMLSPVARVVRQQPGTPGLIAALGVGALPAVYLLDGQGRVTASGHGLDGLPVPAHA
ncbi:hypothetical protein AB0J20_09165 [Micromonospora costi]|uniref:TlpA family protein disulfide reductase n=1 Tax=Micromonospora costi TaxID=1530042 RepID=UPI003400E257